MEHILEQALGHEDSQASAAEKRDLLARLLGRLAHEIRNPLSSLDIHVQLLEEDVGEVDAKLRERLVSRLGIIRGELHRLESIVSQFLRLAGPSGLDLEPVDISHIVNHVCDLLRPEAGERGIELSRRLEPEIPRVLADPVRLTQALLNLVINALQAVQRNGKIEVAALVANEALVVSVRDNGPGIPAEKLASIFDPYFTTKAEGHGLGLWIAQQIVTAHGGSLRAQNVEGGGAVFVCSIPLKRPVPQKSEART